MLRHSPRTAPRRSRRRAAAVTVLLCAALAQVLGLIVHLPMAIAMELAPGQMLEICSPTAPDTRPDDRGPLPGMVCHDCLAAQMAMPPADAPPVPLRIGSFILPAMLPPAGLPAVTAAVSPVPARAPPLSES